MLAGLLLFAAIVLLIYNENTQEGETKNEQMAKDDSNRAGSRAGRKQVRHRQHHRIRLSHAAPSKAPSPPEVLPVAATQQVNGAVQEKASQTQPVIEPVEKGKE